MTNSMVEFTGVRGNVFTLNVNHIMRVEQQGDTIIVCSNGQRIRVADSCNSVVQKINNVGKRQKQP